MCGYHCFPSPALWLTWFLEYPVFVLSCFFLLLIHSPPSPVLYRDYFLWCTIHLPNPNSVAGFSVQMPVPQEAEVRGPRCAPLLLACLHPPLACGCPESIFLFSFVSPEPAQCRIRTQYLPTVYTLKYEWLSDLPKSDENCTALLRAKGKEETGNRAISDWGLEFNEIMRECQTEIKRQGCGVERERVL